MSKATLDRRRFLIGSGIAGIAGAAAAANIHDGELGAPPKTYRGAVPWVEGTADAPPGASGTGYNFFTPTKAAFIEAAVARLIPHDDVGPGAVEAGVPFFLDRQFSGPLGRGDHYFLGGPWPKGTPEQAIKAGSARPSSIAPRLWRSTNTPPRPSMARLSPSLRRPTRTRF